MSSTNPLLGMAVYSLSNALELYKNNDTGSGERRRFGAIILMDLSVEYILKAKLYQIDQNEFIQKQGELGFSNCMNDKRIVFLEGEKPILWTAHGARNFSQHRGSITDSLFSEQYMKWLCKFVDRFAKDNFQYNIIQKIPPELRVSWTKLTDDSVKGERSKPDLKEPLLENYHSTIEWIKEKKAKSRRGFLRVDNLVSLSTNLRRYCNFLSMNPDQIIESSLDGTSSPSDDLEKFLKTLTSQSTLYGILKSFYQVNEIKIDLPCPKYQRVVSSSKEITTAQLRQLCDFSKMREKSWILANSYMGLKVGNLALLTVRDFRTELWNAERKIYPVKIRQEVSNYYDYTTFIGADAKNVLQNYFQEKRLTLEDHPWNYRGRCIFNDSFRRNCEKLGFYEKSKISPKSLEKRLKNILKESGMPHEWVCYLVGAAPYIRYKTTKVDSPLYDELYEAYERAYPKLRVYEE